MSSSMPRISKRKSPPRLRRSVEAAVREGRLGYEESGRLLRFYEEGLHGYTYLEDPHER